MQKHNNKTINKIHWPKIWNELPEKIKLCKSLSTFVKKSKAFFLEQQLN